MATNDFSALSELAQRLNEANQYRSSYADLAVRDALKIMYDNLAHYRAQLSDEAQGQIKSLMDHLGFLEIDGINPPLHEFMKELQALHMIDIQLRDNRFCVEFTYAGQVLSSALFRKRR